MLNRIKNSRVSPQADQHFLLFVRPFFVRSFASFLQDQHPVGEDGEDDEDEVLAWEFEECNPKSTLKPRGCEWLWPSCDMLGWPACILFP